MKPFIHDNFLLQTPTAIGLYHDHAKHLPIIDFHCHLSPKQIAEDHHFASITELWLGGDHYKWRAMRANGVAEDFITGSASDWEKFEKWAETVPYTLRNPLYHWTHLELKTAFGIDKVLNPSTAREIFEICNEQLSTPSFSARGLMEKYHVECVCTTDDPIDSLEHHQAIRESGFSVKVLPAWRPDKATAVADPHTYYIYVQQLEKASGVEVRCLDDMLQALQVRHDFFAAQGCSVADHGVSQFPFRLASKKQLDQWFQQVLAGQTVGDDAVESLHTHILLELARMNARKGWVQQFHFGPLRNTNKKMFRLLGPDAGFDTIGDFHSAHAIVSFLNQLAEEDLLAKTILYNINPVENDIMAAVIANFQDGEMAGKLQLGSGWWFNDHKNGMEKQLNALSEQGLLSRFVGMLTDSRSFLSYPRHEYFRRVLCNLIGKDVEDGLIPLQEIGRVEQMIEDICYYNPKQYFRF
ncbi:MAG: glucuronate isomerase [Bacteroidaceae bacterium]|nr:glucuronate isomerase [Bacteroidaceae bacterium]